MRRVTHQGLVMSFNTLRQLPVLCPMCNHRSWHTEFQFRTGVSHIFNDGKESFSLRTYDLGEKLAWLSPKDRNYAEWRRTADRWCDATDSAEEDLEVRCWNCHADLVVTIYFEILFITPAIGVSPVDAATEYPN